MFVDGAALVYHAIFQALKMLVFGWQLYQQVMMVKQNIENLKNFNIEAYAMSRVMTVANSSNGKYRRNNDIVSYTNPYTLMQHAEKFIGLNKLEKDLRGENETQTRHDSNQSALETIRAALDVGHGHDEDIRTRGMKLDVLKAQSSAAAGNLQAQQAGNGILAEAADTAHATRLAVMDQTNVSAAGFSALVNNEARTSRATWDTANATGSASLAAFWNEPRSTYLKPPETLHE